MPSPNLELHAGRTSLNAGASARGACSFAILALSVSVWWFGGGAIEAQCVLGILCSLSAVVARPFAHGRSAKAKLWLPGFLLLLWIAVQSVNHRIEVVAAGDLWWAEARPFLEWLPSGVDAPSGWGNGWTQILFLVAPYTLVLALSFITLFPRWRTLLVQSLTLQAGALGGVGLLVMASGTTRLLCIWSVDADYFFGPILYKNHAAALLVLLVAVAFTEFRRALSKRVDRTSGWTLVAGTCALMGWMGLVATRSAFGVGCAAMLFAWTLVSLFIRFRGLRLVVALGAATSIGLVVLILGPTLAAKLNHWQEGKAETSVDMRVAAISAGMEMWKERPLVGWGAGAFQYGFTKYKRQIPLLDRNRHLQLRWEHLHSDWLECLIEWGALGCVPLVTMVFLIARSAGRPGRWVTNDSELLWTAVFLIGTQAFFDFPLRSPAVLLHLCAVGAVAVRQRPERPSNSTREGSSPGPRGAINSRIC